MTVRELITELSQMPPEMDVRLWVEHAGPAEVVKLISEEPYEPYVVIADKESA